MSLLNSMVNVSRVVGRVVIDHAPEILVVGGLVAGAATTVKACKATKELTLSVMNYGELDEHLKAVEEAMDEDGTVESSDGRVITLDDLREVRRDAVKGLMKEAVIEYGPALVLGSVSVLSILAGMQVFKARHAAVVAAYASLESGFRLYRSRVISDQGEEADWRYRTGTIMKKVEQEVVDEETGKATKKKVKVPVVEEGVESADYTINYLREATWLSETRDLTRVLSDLVEYEHSMNSILRAEKMLTLNDARRIMHLMPKGIGQFAGWTMDGEGDCEVKLNPRIVYDEYLGHDTIILDPNVDGLMVHKIDGIVKDLRGF